MAAQPGTLERIVAAIGALLTPFEEAMHPEGILDLLAEFGLEFPVSIQTDATLANALNSVSVYLQSIQSLSSEIAAAVEADDTGTIAADAIKLAEAIVSLVGALSTFTTALKAAGAGGGITQAELDQFADALFQSLLEYTVVVDLEKLPGVVEALQFIGVVDRTEVPAVDASHPAFIKRSIDVSALAKFVQNPAGALGDLYQWGRPTFDGLALLQELARLLAQIGLPAVVDTSGPVPVLDLMFIEIRPRTDLDPRSLSFSLTQKAGVTGAPTFAAGDFQITIMVSGDFAGGTEIVFQPDDTVHITPPSGTLSGEITVQATAGSPNGDPYLILGENGGSSVTVQQLSAGFGATLAWNTAKQQADAGLEITGSLTNGKFAVDLGDADGFLSTIFSGQGLESDFTVQFRFSTQAGLHFEASASLDIQLPMHVTLGPVDLTALVLSIGLAGSGIEVGLAADISASLGPLQAAVQELGFGVIATLPPDHSGNAGPVDFSLAFKPPKGVALSIDAGVVSGGGYLYIDAARGEYAGALQLEFADFLTLAAIGLIDTKLPDGSSGFSLLVIITADFGAGIQLGFGFTLNAVGGLLGVNRVMLFQPLMDAVRSGAIDDIMFPQNVVANAPKIISDLSAIFPPQEATFLIGPLAKLGWGEPTLVSLSLGVIIEIPPGDIAILGVLKLVLPADDLAILVLQVNFAGALEFSKQRMYFFASLFDSHILFITIEGEMGLLFVWGDNANFVVSVGGFHPQFNPPPLPFPTPKRISVDVLNESYARIHADGYFAVTTNTVQFGAHAEMFFGFSALSVSGHSGFDALIQFSPFHFIASFDTSFSVQVFGIGVFGIDISLSLEGPEPWHAHGTASLSFFFFSIGIGIDFTWGDSGNTTLPPVDVLPVLSAEFGKQSNWRAQLPAGSNLLVSLRKLDAADAALVLHPIGALQVSQRAVPLDLTLDTVGSQKPDDANRFSLAVTSPDLAQTKTLTEQFAPAQFKSADDATKLSQAAYAPFDSGIEMAAAGESYASGTSIVRIVRYDVTIIDTKLLRSQSRFTRYPGTLFQIGLRGNASARAVLSASREKQTHPFDGSVAVSPETFAVALRSDNTVYHPNAAAFTSQAAARDYIDRVVAAEPARAETLHVLPQFEVVR